MAQPTPDMATWFVATKLNPPLVRDDTIRRPRIEAALTSSVSTLPLTLLSAPAGYGKTTTLAALPRLLPAVPLAWVTLDSEDNDPIRFLGLIVSALQRLHPECGRAVWPWLSGGAADMSGLKRAIGALINDILKYLPAPFILVLDDLHFVTEPAVYVALEYLFDHQPAQLHVAVGTRHDPPLRLARLVARRQLAELRRSDLSFSNDEAGALLNGTLGLSLSAAEVTALQDRTEGWPAGLCLLAGPLGRMDTETDRSLFMAAIAQSERYALDFLAGEVLRDFPGDIRRFLLQTSVLSEMTPSACRAVTGRDDAADVLDQLYRQNLTIASITSEAGGEPVYRHHALFIRLLTNQLEREAPGEIAELHRRAAAVQKTPGRAIAHYLAAGLWDQAVLLMLQSGMELLSRGMTETVRNWWSGLPAEIQSRHPQLAVLTARCEIHRGDYLAAEKLLSQAREAFVAAGDEVGEGDALASLITLAYQSSDRDAAAALVERASQLPLRPFSQVAVRLAHAWIKLAAGDWSGCRADIDAGLAIPRVTGDRRSDFIGISYMSAPMAAVPGCLEITERYCSEARARALPDTAWQLGATELGTWPLVWRGRLTLALADAEAAEGLRQRIGGYPFLGTDLAIVLATVHITRGNREAAELATDSLIQRIDAAAGGKQAFYLHAAGRLLAQLGRTAEAQAMNRRLGDQRDDTPLTRYLSQHLAGLIALLDGHQADAADALEQAVRLETDLPIAWVGGSARLLQARLLLEQGNPDGSLAAVIPVLRQWELAGTPGCAILDGPVGLPVLRLAVGRGVAAARGMLQLFAEAHSASGDRPSPSDDVGRDDSADLLELLTHREREVLALIVAGRTNRQIGEALYIGEETVKSHVVHILRKLDVTSRTQAAIRGRELGF